MSLPTISNTAMARVLQVPELFDIIISDLDKGTLTKVARVNKTWSSIALGRLWQSQTDLRPLFDLLAPKGYELVGNKPAFKEIPRDKDWHRFFKYSSLVKSLRVDDTNERYPHLLDAYARFRPSDLCPNGNFFPALRTLEWIAPNEMSLINRSVLFMHQGIQNFLITLPSTYAHTVPGPLLRQYIDLAICRMPTVRRLSVSMNGYMAVVEASIIRLVKGWAKTLVGLKVPRYWVSSALIETLSTLSVLEEFEGNNDVLGVYDPARPFRPTIMKPWPALKKFHIAARFQEVIHFLKKDNLPNNLTELFIYTPRIEPRVLIQELCVEIAKRLPSLRCLLISKCHARPLEQILRPALEDCPSITDLQPLFDTLPLTEFSFHHENPLLFKEGKVAEIARKLPNIVYLDLNPSPDYDLASYSRGDFPSLASLPFFGQSSSRLAELGLYVDPVNVDCVQMKEPDPLDCLVELSLGGPGSIIGPNADDTLMFLSRILYQGCTVSSATLHRSRGVPRIVADRREEFWVKVNDRLPLLIRVRMEEGEHYLKVCRVVERCEEEIRRCAGDLSVLDDMFDHDGDEDVVGGGVADLPRVRATPPPTYSVM